MTDYSGWVYETLGGESTGNDEIPVDCISCGKEKHMYVNARTGLAHCFKCNYSANFIQLVQDVEGIDRGEAVAKFRSMLRKINRSSDTASIRAIVTSKMKKMGRSDVAGTSDFADKKTTVTLPRHTDIDDVLSAKALEARSYLASRGFTEEFYKRYKLGVITDANHKAYGDILFPNFRYTVSKRGWYTRLQQTEEIDFYTTRAVRDRKPKSYNASGVERRLIVFGKWALRENISTVFLVEGPLDMIALSGQSIALLGKSMTPAVLNFLVDEVTNIIVALDPDAGEQAHGICSTLANRFNKNVFTLHKLNGDPADNIQETPAKTIAHILRYVRKYDARERLKSRLYMGAMQKSEGMAAQP